RRGELRRAIRAELRKGGVETSRHYLCAACRKAGRQLEIFENERNLNNKISRGGFSAAFFLQCLRSIGVNDLRFD
ncbi:hypothetical protein CNY89_22710, partial [Amaricoccus sp. HAR-UPW-R2A-40]